VFAPGDVISYLEMCQQEGVNLQQGMNFRLRGGVGVILMSMRAGAPYADQVEDGGRILVYEGHDRPRVRGGPDPKTLDQELQTPAGTPTQNGLFFEAARGAQEGRGRAELVRVYEKVRTGIWVFNGVFRLLDAWAEQIEGRRVFKFRLEITADEAALEEVRDGVLEPTRLIPTSVRLEVWKRDKGRCVECGSADNLHFDHIIPWSRGGSSLTAENIQLLCAHHNIAKRDRIL
jgi:HNH endonuclease